MKARFFSASIATPSLIALAVTTGFISSVQAAEIKKKNVDDDIEMIVVKGQATGGLDRLVTEEELATIQADDLSDVFRREPGVSVGGSVGMGQKIYLRNIGEDLLNVSIDGAEQAGAVFHHSGRIAIEPELLKRVEIEAGTASATAGPGALGGAVRMTTKDPMDLLNDDQQFGALVKGGYFSNGDGFKSSATVYGRNQSGDLSAMASYVTSSQDDLDDGNGDEITGTESERDFGYAKVVANLTDNQYISVSYENLQEEGNILYKPELIAGPRNVPEPTEGNRETFIVNYGYNDTNNQWVDFLVNAYHTEQDQAREFRGTSYDGYVKTIGLKIQNKSQIGMHQLIYGVNFRDDESLLNDVDLAPFVFEETGDVRGLFLQDVIEFSPALTVSLGARYDDYSLTDVNGLEFNDSGVSPNISANYSLTDSLSLSAGYAEALRGVEVKDSFKLSTASNADDLEAEKASNIEVGLDYQANNFAVGIGAYTAKIENPIAGVVPWSRVAENLEDDIETDGYYLDASYKVAALDLSARVNIADTELGNSPVTRYVYSSSAASTGDTLVLTANYQFNEALAAGWAGEFVKGLHNLNLNVGGDILNVDKPGYGVHDIYVRWFPMQTDTLTVTLTAKNVFDKQYLNHASVEDFQDNAGWEGIAGSPEAGRDIRLSVGYRF